MPNFLWDNDIIFKSIDWGLYDIFLDFLSNSDANHFYLAQCKFIGRKKYSRDIESEKKTEQLENLLAKMDRLHEVLEGEITSFFNAEKFSVDTGEALLIQTLQNQEGWMLTGDKKALRELEKIPTSQLDLSFLHGKVIVWEDLLMYIVQNYDWKVIQECVKSVSTIDTMFRTVFSAHNQKKRDSAIESIQSYQKTNYKEFKKFLLSPTKIKKVFSP